MRCLSCQKISFRTFCKECQKSLLKPNITKRVVGTLDVYSFYKYSTIETILLTKHTNLGYRVFSSIADITFKPFINEFVSNDSRKIYIVGIDEKVKNGYSHVALLTNSMKSKSSKVLHASLISSNNTTYSGKTLQFRLENPRNFVYRGKKDIDVILIDDIITTGTTLQEAQKVLQESGVNVLFALTLADAKE
ncbi:MAG: phosphoribosyltransferase [Sulfurovum sp. AS07-7]|nr:MAG: phosphoribosyltransferase [Sulfurovum sp. AS07-7]